MLTVLDLFSGIGGISLGLESTGGFQTIGFCEIEPFPRAVLRKHWPEVPIYDDVRRLSADSLGGLLPDVICGGFPCQDISVAGKGAGLGGKRSGLWSEYARLVGELRPRWVIAENVGALRTRGVDRVCSDLEGEGYSVWPLLVGAWAAGAPHKRDRVWIIARKRLADSHGERDESERGSTEERIRQLQQSPATKVGGADGRGERPVGDTERAASKRRTRGQELLDHGPEAGRQQGERRPVGHGEARWPARPGEPQWEWEEPRLAYTSVRPGVYVPRAGGDATQASSRSEGGPFADRHIAGDPGEGSPELPLGGSVDGLPLRLVRRANREALKALGNSVVPQVVEAVGRAILKAEEEFNR